MILKKSSHSSKTQQDPRSLAFFILNRLEDKRQTLDFLLDSCADATEGFARCDQALFTALVFGVLRWRKRIDWIISKFSKRPIEKVQSAVLNLLRLGTFQIIFLDRIPDSAAVNTSVNLAKTTGAPWVKGFVNAVLRNIARKRDQLIYASPDENPVLTLAVQKSFPEWMLARWIDRMGLEETSLLCDMLNTIAPLTIRTNTLKCTREDLLSRLADDAQSVSKTPFSTVGIHCRGARRSLHSWASFQSGCFQVQDEGAQLAGMLANPRPGETILDACAGVGGKTGHMGQLMQNKGRILAIDRSSRKLQQLSADMQRLGVTISTTETVDLDRRPLTPQSWGHFDRVIVDAPCSGLGVLRRNPDIKWYRRESQLRSNASCQLRFLNNIAQLVRLNGLLVYVVCSIEPEENGNIITQFIKSRPGFIVDTRAPDLPAAPGKPLFVGGQLKTVPHIHNMDGFFGMRLRRIK